MLRRREGPGKVKSSSVVFGMCQDDVVVCVSICKVFREY